MTEQKKTLLKHLNFLNKFDAVHLVKEFIKKFLNDGGLLNASLLSYITIVTFVPLISIILALFRNLFHKKESLNQVTNFIFSEFFPEAGAVIQDYISNLIESRGGFITAFGVLTVIIASGSLLKNVQSTLDNIWSKTTKSIFLRKYLILWLILLISIPALASISTFSLVLQNEILQIENPITHFIVNNGVLIMAFVSTFWIFFAIYYFVSTDYVPMKSALAGAGFATILWYIFKEGFTYYIEHFASYDQVYGSLWAIPVFFLWIFLTWVDVILGFEFAYFTLYYKNILRAKDKKADERYRNYYILKILQIINRHFKQNHGPASVSRVVNLSAYPYTEVNEILDSLISAKVLVRAEQHYRVLPRRELNDLDIKSVIESCGNSFFLVPSERRTNFDERVRQAFSKIENCRQKELAKYSFKHFYVGKRRSPADNNKASEK